jgi:AcrR family transcriptional regulator
MPSIEDVSISGGSPVLVQETAASELPVKASRVDGRRQRSERTRQAIIEAYLELLRRNPRMPTAAQIAAEAGISTRSIFERFSDLNALTLATADHAIAQAQAEAVARDVDADRPTRIRSHVVTRSLACERWMSLWRVLVTAQDALGELRARVKLTRLANIERMKLMYRAELSTLAEPARERLLLALATLISFESWNQMRDCHGLSIEAAQEVWRSAIDRMLPSADA